MAGGLRPRADRAGGAAYLRGRKNDAQTRRTASRRVTWPDASKACSPISRWMTFSRCRSRTVGRARISECRLRSEEAHAFATLMLISGGRSDAPPHAAKGAGGQRGVPRAENGGEHPDETHSPVRHCFLP